ncbi:cytochrome P450 [Tanacetum coccineum]
MESINGINVSHTQHRNNRKRKNNRAIASQPTCSTTHSNSWEVAISDSLSLINRCNLRILSRPIPSLSRDSIEINNIVNLGNHLGFDLAGKESDVKRALNNGVTSGLQETMALKIDSFLIHALWNNSSFDFVFKKSDGKSGGLLSGSGKWLPTDDACLFVVAYAPQCIHKKKTLWDELNKMTLDLDCLTIILGDFNVVRNATERSGSVFCQRSATAFNSFISSTGLADIPLGGTRFTRMNRQGSKLSKLDRFLVSSNFLANWPNAHISTLTRDYSDHAPILLHVEAADFGPPPFRFYNSWLSKKDFEPILIDSWALRFVRPTSYFVIFKSKL